MARKYTEHKKKYMKKRYRKNTKAVLAYEKKYYDEHKELIRLRKKEHPEVWRQYSKTKNVKQRQEKELYKTRQNGWS